MAAGKRAIEDLVLAEKTGEAGHAGDRERADQALTVELPLFLPMAVAVISGDTVAGEANVGTLRYLLATPVRRSRLLSVKYLALLISTAFAVLLIAVVGVVLGLVLFGASGAIAR